MQLHSCLAAPVQQHLSLEKLGFCGLNHLGCWFCMGDLKALVTCIGSPGKQQSSRAHCTDTGSWARWSQCYMKGQLLYPPQPSATVHTVLRIWDTDSALLPCSGCLAKPLPGKQGAEPGKKKSYMDREISYFGRLLYCSCGWGRVGGRWGNAGAGNPSPNVVTPAQ